MLKSVLSAIAMLLITTAVHAQSGCRGYEASFGQRRLEVYQTFQASSGAGCVGGEFRETHPAFTPLRNVAAAVNDARPHWFAPRERHVIRERYTSTGTAPRGSGYKVMPRGPAPVVVQVAPVVQAPQALSRPVLFDGKIIRRFLAKQGVSQVELDRVEVRYGMSSGVWLEVLKAFLAGGLPAALEKLKELLL